jgi:hypothetical protein
MESGAGEPGAGEPAGESGAGESGAGDSGAAELDVGGPTGQVPGGHPAGFQAPDAPGLDGEAGSTAAPGDPGGTPVAGDPVVDGPPA